ncbi:MAG TPA: FAD:protein FMN transferase [Vicinamibacterales bacterium]|jgi:thiamine biosynthesis lipoprotein|nr:FAD:protein FMN transferase [Vicinamibacterales bacterium]
MSGTLTRRNFLSFDFGDRRGGADHWIRIHRIAMACRFEVMLSSDDAADVSAARAALDEADEIEAILTVFRETSDVVDLNNRAAAEPVRVAPALFALLERSAELHARTEGAFDITSTPLSRCWGFLKREGRLPPDDAIEHARTLVGMRHVHLDSAQRTVRFDHGGVELNFGAIGKGYALDRMGEVLRARGTRRALLSAGRSSVLALGGHGRGWPIDVRPRLASRKVGRLWIRSGAVGTSGAGEQFIEVEGRRYGHVIDPRTGRPAFGVLGASVIAPDAASADALSTAFLIAGPDLATRYCAAHPGTMAVLVMDDPVETTSVFGRYNGATLEMLT